MAILASEGAISIQQESAFRLAGIAGGGIRAVEFLQVVLRSGGEAELVADEVIEHSAGIAADGAVRFVRDDEVEIRGREIALVFVVENVSVPAVHTSSWFGVV